MRSLLLCFFAVLLHSSTVAQQMDSLLQVYNEKYVSEKTYIHFDKPVYNPGETIWFKAYLLAGNHTWAGSTSFYTELIDEKGQVLERKVYPISESTAHGDFAIPGNINNKYLVFRGYTTWMLNFDTAFLFTRVIPIAQSASSGASATVNRSIPVLQFYPEGGDLIAELPSVLAFKATDSQGYPISASGVIRDKDGKYIDSFKTVHDGMGQIKFKPAAKASYYAEWSYADQGLQRTQLPVVKEDGIVLEAVQDSKGQHIIVTRRENASPQFNTVYVLAQMNHKVVFKARANLSTFRAIKGTIQLDSLSTGILQITAFDENWKPLAERITFINKGDKIFPTTVSAVARDSAKRQKNIVDIEIPADVVANLSVAVTDAQVVMKPSSGHSILSGLLLTADLRGYIHNPDYYFSSGSEVVRQHLNLLMLTSGWRKYDWKAIAAAQLPAMRYERDNYLTIHGSPADKGDLKLKSKTELNLILQSAQTPKQVFNVPLSKNGVFKIDGLVFYDSTKVFYDFGKNTKAPSAIKFNIGTNIPIAYTQVQPLPVPDLDAYPLIAARNLYQRPNSDNNELKSLDTVTVKSKPKTKLQEMERQYTRGFFQTTEGAASINVLDDPSASGMDNLVDYIRMKYPVIQLTNKGKKSFVWGSAVTSILGGQTATELYLDEMPVDVESILNMRMNDIAYIKLFRPPFAFAKQGGAGGAIAIYSRRGADLEREGINNEMESVLIKGYASAKVFSAPDYATFTPPADYQDIRTTLYWNPILIIDSSTRKQRIEFYNNDSTRSFRVIVEGVNNKGQLTRVEKIIQ